MYSENGSTLRHSFPISYGAFLSIIFVAASQVADQFYERNSGVIGDLVRDRIVELAKNFSFH